MSAASDKYDDGTVEDQLALLPRSSSTLEVCLRGGEWPGARLVLRSASGLVVGVIDVRAHELAPLRDAFAVAEGRLDARPRVRRVEGRRRR